MDSLEQFAAAIRLGRDLDGIACVNYSSERGLEVYRNNYRGGLQDALANAYPVCKQLVGEAFFIQVAKQYIAGHFVYSANLHDYGAEFADFLPQLTRVRYLADMARLEWAYHRAYFAVDQSQTVMQQLALVEDWSMVRCGLHPSCYLLQSSYPLSDIWQLHQQVEPDWQSLNWEDEVRYFLVCRPQQTVQIVDLPAVQYCWLQHLQQGESMEQACEYVLNEFSEFDVGGSLQHWITQGVLSRLEFIK